jgi:hypothetical protein
MVRIFFSVFSFTVTIFAFSLSLTKAHADVLFEGYSKVMSGGVHIGYAINRYEYDAKKKQFISTSFLKTGELGGNITESLSAIANDDLKPLSYQYTTLMGKTTKTIDAKFEKGKISATVRDGANVEKISKELPKGTFLSTFLAYVMLKSKEGLKADLKYDYKAIAEEDAAVYDGLAFIKNQEDFNGLKALRVLNEFKKTKFVSLINDRGEVYQTKSPAQSISTELVAQPAQATGNFQIPTALLRKLYGDVPTGQINEVSKRAQALKAPAPEPTPIPGKQIGVPGGKGLHLKGQPSTPEPTPEQKKEESK